MRITLSFRDAFYAGIAIAIIASGFCIWLWQPERQVDRHSEHLFRQVEARDWRGLEDSLAGDYLDQWGQDRALVISRLQEIFRFLRGAKIEASDSIVQANRSRGTWRGKIRINGNGDEAIVFIRERLNSLNTPFELEWRRVSTKPWDWKLARVSNPALEIPEGGDL